MISEWTSDRVKAVRKAMGETQEQFAAHFRLHPEAIRTWEQNRGNPSGPATVILDELERACGCDPKSNGRQKAKAGV